MPNTHTRLCLFGRGTIYLTLPSNLSSSFSSSPLFHQPLVDDLSLDACINHLRSFAESVAVLILSRRSAKMTFQIWDL